MNTRQALCLVGLIVSAAGLVAGPPEVASFKKDFSQAPSLELPARAAAAVSAAPRNGRRAVADDVVRAAIELDPSAGPQLIGVIAGSTPDVAASSAAVAASLQPKQISAITKAAVSVAHGQTETIVSNLVAAQPNSFATIGIAAAEVSPQPLSVIVRGITSANPTLKTLITSVDAKTPTNLSSLVSVLKRADALLAQVATQSKSTPAAIAAGELTPAMHSQIPALAATVNAAAANPNSPYTPGLPSPGEINTSRKLDLPPPSRSVTP
jgi:hypothetical protein